MKNIAHLKEYIEMAKLGSCDPVALRDKYLHLSQKSLHQHAYQIKCSPSTLSKQRDHTIRPRSCLFLTKSALHLGMSKFEAIAYSNGFGFELDCALVKHQACRVFIESEFYSKDSTSKERTVLDELIKLCDGKDSKNEISLILYKIAEEEASKRVSFRQLIETLLEEKNEEKSNLQSFLREVCSESMAYRIFNPTECVLSVEVLLSICCYFNLSVFEAKNLFKCAGRNLISIVCEDRKARYFIENCIPRIRANTARIKEKDERNFFEILAEEVKKVLNSMRAV